MSGAAMNWTRERHVTAYSGGERGDGMSSVTLHFSDDTKETSVFPTPDYGPLVILPRPSR